MPVRVIRRAGNPPENTVCHILLLYCTHDILLHSAWSNVILFLLGANITSSHMQVVPGPWQVQKSGGRGRIIFYTIITLKLTCFKTFIHVQYINRQKTGGSCPPV